MTAVNVNGGQTFTMVIDTESNRMDQRWIREAIHIRKEQNKSMNGDEGPINFFMSMITYCPLQLKMTDD